MTVDLVILITTRPGLGSRQVEAFERLAPLVRAEPGCIRYDMHRAAGDDDRFILFEQWESQEALDAHDVAPHMTAQDAENALFRAGPVTVVSYDAQPIAPA
jgi:quinol monooxygenase YgiN